MRFNTFVKITTVAWSCAFLGGFVTGKSAFGDIFNGKPPHNHIECMAKNIYFEAKSQSLAGQIAVGLVVLNRVKSEIYPNTICGVIEDAKISQWWLKEKGLKKPIKHMCQFSWYCDGKSDEIKDHYTYNQLYVLAEGLVSTNFKTLLDITDGALYYHADYVKPKWSRHFEKTVKIGRHIFYRRR